MATEHSGAHSMDPGASPVPRAQRQPAGEPTQALPHGPRESGQHDPGYARPVDNREEHGRDDRVLAEPVVVDPEAVATAQKGEHGGLKIGSALFGWLTATGMAILLAAVVTAIGTGGSLASDTDITKASDIATSNSHTIAVVAAVVLLVILFVSYYCGGYVAGRMARFNGLRQGVAVWVWALIIAIAVAIVAATTGQKYNILATLNAFPRIPIKEGTVTTTGLIALVVVAVVCLIAAMLGGLAGMHYHRNVDKTGAAIIEDHTNRR